MTTRTRLAMFSGVLTASHQFISGKLGEKLPEPCPELSPTIRVEGRARLGVAAEAETGALAEANKVAKLTTDNKATFLTDAVEVEARALAEAGGKASLEADGAEAEEKAKIGAAQDDHGGGVHKSDIDVEVITCRGLPGGDLDSNRGVGGDVRRDGEGIPTRWELPRSESDPGEGAGRNGEVTLIICKRGPCLGSWFGAMVGGGRYGYHFEFWCQDHKVCNPLTTESAEGTDASNKWLFLWTFGGFGATISGNLG